MLIETTDLQLVLYSPGHLLALIDGEDPFRASFGLAAADGLRAFIVSDDVSPGWLEQLHASSQADPWIHGIAVVDRESRSGLDDPFTVTARQPQGSPPIARARSASWSHTVSMLGCCTNRSKAAPGRSASLSFANLECHAPECSQQKGPEP